MVCCRALRVVRSHVARQEPGNSPDNVGVALEEWLDLSPDDAGQCDAPRTAAQGTYRSGGWAWLGVAVTRGVMAQCQEPFGSCACNDFGKKCRRVRRRRAWGVEPKVRIWRNSLSGAMRRVLCSGLDDLALRLAMMLNDCTLALKWAPLSDGWQVFGCSGHA